VSMPRRKRSVQKTRSNSKTANDDAESDADEGKDETLHTPTELTVSPGKAFGKHNDRFGKTVSVELEDIGTLPTPPWKKRKIGNSATDSQARSPSKSIFDTPTKHKPQQDEMEVDTELVKSKKAKTPKQPEQESEQEKTLPNQEETEPKNEKKDEKKDEKKEKRDEKKDKKKEEKKKTLAKFWQNKSKEMDEYDDADLEEEELAQSTPKDALDKSYVDETPLLIDPSALITKKQDLSSSLGELDEYDDFLAEEYDRPDRRSIGLQLIKKRRASFTDDKTREAYTNFAANDFALTDEEIKFVTSNVTKEDKKSLKSGRGGVEEDEKEEDSSQNEAKPKKKAEQKKRKRRSTY